MVKTSWIPGAKSLLYNSKKDFKDKDLTEISKFFLNVVSNISIASVLILSTTWFVRVKKRGISSREKSFI